MCVYPHPKAVKQRMRERTTRMPMIFSRSICRWPRPSTVCRREAVLPKNVFMPVNSTVPSTSPRTTVEPILGELPMIMVTGRDSPVRAAWVCARRTFVCLICGMIQNNVKRIKS